MNPAVMPGRVNTDKLIEEIDRYLAAIDLFRAQGCEPTWHLEMHSRLVSLERSLSDLQEHRVVH